MSKDQVSADSKPTQSAPVDPDQRNRRIIALSNARHELRTRLYGIEEELRALHALAALDRYTCHCVNLNAKMGIHDMTEQERRNRNGLQLGLVSETLSASRSCPDCGGSGIPRSASGIKTGEGW